MQWLRSEEQAYNHYVMDKVLPPDNMLRQLFIFVSTGEYAYGMDIRFDYD